jgi:hypothetical protein
MEEAYRLAFPHSNWDPLELWRYCPERVKSRTSTAVGLGQAADSVARRMISYRVLAALLVLILCSLSRRLTVAVRCGPTPDCGPGISGLGASDMEADPVREWPKRNDAADQWGEQR